MRKGRGIAHPLSAGNHRLQAPVLDQGCRSPPPAGVCDVITDEEMIEGLSFAAFRRVATMIVLPVAASHGLATEMISIGSVDLSDAQRIDASLRDD